MITTIILLVVGLAVIALLAYAARAFLVSVNAPPTAQTFVWIIACLIALWLLLSTFGLVPGGLKTLSDSW
jgi:hypothetical protein